MQHLVRRAVTTLVAALPAAAAVALPGAVASGTVAGTSASASAAAATPRVLTCAGKAVVEPASYVLTCADANTYFAGTHWTRWGPTSATGRGTFVQNSCQPNCAAGHFVKYPGILTLSKPEETKYGELFSVVHYSYTVSASMTLPLRSR